MHSLTVLLLGPPRIELDNEPLTFNRRKSLALLAYLAVEPAPHSRDSVAALLWPGYGQTSARSNLRRTLSLLNADLGQGWLDVDRESIALPSQSGLFIDVVAFQKRLSACEGHGHSRSQICAECLPLLQEAVALYRDDFLSGFTLADSESFDDWQMQQTDSLRRQLADALQRLAQCLAQDGDFSDAVAHARRRLALDPLHEPAYRTLMRLHAQAGDRSAAVRQYEECVQTLAGELAMQPEAATTALFEEIRAGRDIALAESQEEAESSRKPLHNLPEQPTSFVGRTQELAQIQQHLDDSHCRLLTIVGPGGMGKTRLAIQAARQLQHVYEDGVFFVDFTSVTSPDALAATILHAVAPDDYGDINAQRRLCECLSAKQSLLVLDNFEHLLEGADLLPELLRNAPDIKIIVTSRERLNLREEWLQPLHGLAFPGPNDDSPPLNEFDATRLFLDSVRRVRPNYQPSTDDKRTISSICALLEGMPLAIELAAAWLRTLPLEEVNVELEHGLSILTTTMRDMPERHRSMHAVFDQSWRILSPDERSILRQMSVFRGGCTREAVEVVTEAGLAELTSLVDSSWLRLRASGRYDMHELVRQYCEEKLGSEHESETGEESMEVYRRHCDYYARLMTEPASQANFSISVNELFMQEFNNIHTGLRRAASLPHFITVRPLLMGLWYTSDMLGRQMSTYDLLTEVSMSLTDHSVRASDIYRQNEINETLAEIGTAQGIIASSLGLLEKSRDHNQKVIALADTIQSLEVARFYRAITSLRRCILAWEEGYFQASLHFGLDALSQFEDEDFASIWYGGERGRIWHQADILPAVGYANWYLGNYREAERNWRRSIALADVIGEKRLKPQHFAQLARLLVTVGNYAEAEQMALKSIEGSAAVGDEDWAAFAHASLSCVQRSQNRHAEARRNLLTATRRYRLTRNLRLLDVFIESGRQNLADQNTSAARDCFHAAIRDIEEIGCVTTKLLAPISLGLGWTALAEGNPAEASERFRQALASGKCAAWEKTEAIAGLGEVAAAEDRHDDAVELLALVAAHPFTAYDQRERSRQSLDTLKAQFSDATFAQRVDAGSNRDLQAAIDELLASTGSDHSTRLG